MFGIKELAVILIIVILLFGTKKLKGMGSDLGSAIKGFKKSMGDDEADKASEADKKLVDESEANTQEQQENTQQHDKQL